MRTSKYLGLTAMICITVASATPRHSSAAEPTMKVVASPKEVQWRPAPPSLPPGAQLAVVSGDASKAAATYALRLKLPDGYVFSPHWHPQDVNVTVISGGLGIGMGDKFDKSKGRLVKSGGYILEPKEMHHYAWAQGSTVIEVYGEGPFGMNYVNPSDDPQTRQQ